MLMASAGKNAITLWGRPSSSNTQKVLWMLAEVGITEYKLILASAKLGPASPFLDSDEKYGVVDTPEYLAMNPNGQIPTVRINDTILWESNTIVRYLSMKFAPQLH